MAAVKPGWVGPMTQSKDGKRPYYCDYGDWDTGKKLRKKLGYTRNEARKEHADFVKKMEAKAHTPNSTRTFGDALDAFEKRCEERHRLWVKAGKSSDRSKEWLAGATAAKYRSGIKHRVRPALGHIRIHELNTRDHLQPFISEMVGRFAAMHIRCYVIIKESLELAVDLGWLAISPLSKKRLSVPPPPPPQVSIPEIEEGRELWLALQARGGGEHRRPFLNRVAQVALAMFGGMEAGVATGLKWSHVDWVSGLINISRSWSPIDGEKGPKNKFRIRTIPMSEEIRSSLIAVWERDGMPTDGYVFYTKPNKDGTRHSVYEQVSNSLRQAQIRLGYVDDKGRPKWSYHEMRHYAGSVWLEADADLKTVSRMLGHSGTAITEKVYIHFFKKQEAKRHRAIVDRVSGMHRLPSAARALPAPMREICEIDAEDIEIVE